MPSAIMDIPGTACSAKTNKGQVLHRRLAASGYDCIAGEDLIQTARTAPAPAGNVSEAHQGAIEATEAPVEGERVANLSFLARERTIAAHGYSRWLIPPAALCVHLCIGQAYAFSVFNLPLT